MNWISTRMRVSIGLACLTLSVLLLSMLIGILPDREKAVLEGRRTLCEAIAVNSSIMVSQQDLARLQAVLKVTAERNPDILSAGLRRDDGALLVEVGDHAAAVETARRQTFHRHAGASADPCRRTSAGATSKSASGPSPRKA